MPVHHHPGGTPERHQRLICAQQNPPKGAASSRPFWFPAPPEWRFYKNSWEFLCDSCKMQL
jgi:hypothetical protein